MSALPPKYRTSGGEGWGEEVFYSKNSFGIASFHVTHHLDIPRTDREHICFHMWQYL